MLFGLLSPPGIASALVRSLLSMVAGALLASAHPMGNLSINHYARLEVAPAHTKLTYILDFAELPTLELLQSWDLADGSAKQLEGKARQYAPQWLRHVRISQDGVQLALRIRTVEAEVTEGAGSLPVLRIGIAADIPEANPGTLQYSDENYADRAGWKEVVVKAAQGAHIQESSRGSNELSRQLTVYPLDPGIVPPQHLDAVVRWTAGGASPNVRWPQPNSPRPTDSSFSSSQSARTAAPGTVQAGDRLSGLLKQSHLSFTLVLLGIGIAFGLGAMHALSPGHGKAIVAAYLVGSRGTVKHALVLGSIVTFTHTLSVFALGLGVLFFQRHVLPDKVVPLLGSVSGLSIVLIGGFLLHGRLRTLVGATDAHSRSHGKAEKMELAWAAAAGSGQTTLRFLPDSAHQHPFVGQSHRHGGSTHSHSLPSDDLAVKPTGLIALGASGGLIPCPSAIILMLSSIALGHTLLGLALLVSFSAGLAVVLVAIGTAVIYANHLLPAESSVRRHPVLRFLPVFSAAFVMIVGVVMTLSSLGVIQPLRVFSG